MNQLFPRVLVINLSARREHPSPTAPSSEAVHPYARWLLWLVCLAVLFANLGGPALFEPDEGRNAEKAREILLLNDWVTPHENFVPVLDKPMFFYWLIAICFEVFGISEWSARLPSALLALACLFLVYRFVRPRWGTWEAMWSVLILVTSVEFFLLARIVILDMTLTFCITLALCSFYAAVHAEDKKAAKLNCFLMYLALGAGTLVKGLIGVIVPGIVFLGYLLVTHRWSILRSLYLVPGTLIFLAIAAPWYVWANARNPDYLSYYFWDEHFGRYLTDGFERSESWFYFFVVVAAGFVPWILLLPAVLKDSWKIHDDKNIFLLLWIGVPLLFFSASNSKLPHYVLPLYPALAILTGQMIAGRFNQPGSKSRRVLYLPGILSVGFVVYLLIGGFWPDLLASEIRTTVVENLLVIVYCTTLIGVIFGSFAYAPVKGYPIKQRTAYICACLGLAVFFLLLGRVMVTASVQRSSKILAQTALSFLTPDSQVAIFNTYVPGLIFNLRLDRPVWVVNPEGRQTWMGSPYVSMRKKNPASGYGKVLVTFNQFADAWNKMPHPPLVFAKAKHVSLLEQQVSAVTQELVRVDDYVLVSRPEQRSVFELRR
jgi:4-amino-4-deoxy-L-arabinose transferase-like glycosyltransferase